MTDIDLVATAVVSFVTAGGTKMLMAPVDAVAEAWRDRVRERIDRVRDRAHSKSEDRPLAPSDLVAYKILTEAAFSDNAITTEYLAGVLAAVSSVDDDNGVPIVAQIGRLSPRQLTLHYIAYREIRRLNANPSVNLYRDSEARRCGVRLHWKELTAIAGWTQTELLSDASRLVREGLLSETWQAGNEASEAGHTWTLQVRPSALGAELFLWGHGSRHVHANFAIQGAHGIPPFMELPDTPGTTLLTPPAVFGGGGGGDDEE